MEALEFCSLESWPFGVQLGEFPLADEVVHDVVHHRGSVLCSPVGTLGFAQFRLRLPKIGLGLLDGAPDFEDLSGLHLSIRELLLFRRECLERQTDLRLSLAAVGVEDLFEFLLQGPEGLARELTPPGHEYQLGDVAFACGGSEHLSPASSHRLVVEGETGRPPIAVNLFATVPGDVLPGGAGSLFDLA